MRDFRQRSRKAIIENIYRGLDNDDIYLDYCRVRRKCLSAASLVLMMAVILYAFFSHYSPYAFTAIIIAFLSGNLSGISTNYVIAIRQWPILKTLLNKEAVRELYKAGLP